MIGVLALTAFAALVAASSSGKFGNCAIRIEDLGCPNKNWRNNGTDRSLCLDTGRTMDWANAPVRTPDLVFYAGHNESDPVTEYVPGEPLKITLAVKKHNKLYLGFFMYAADTNGTKVGTWRIASRGHFQVSVCPTNAITHNGAGLKPAVSEFYFTPPLTSTTTLTIRVVVKAGIANVGEFWLPRRDVVLALKAGAVKQPQTWFRAQLRNQTCTEVCAASCKRGGSCVESDVSSQRLYGLIEREIAPYVACTKPYLLRCSALGPHMQSDGRCYYRNDAACASYGVDVASAQPTCATRAVNEFRICPCECVGEPPTTTRPPTTSTPAPTTTKTTTERTRATGTETYDTVETTTTTSKRPTTTTVTKPPTLPPSETDEPTFTTPEKTTLSPTGTRTITPSGTGPATTTTGGACPAGKAGCACGSPSACDAAAGLACDATANVCVFTKSCMPGEMNCACTAAKTCTNAQSACSDGLCLPTTSYCVESLSSQGCWCSPVTPCLGDLVCSDKGFCTDPTVCFGGDAGCDCLPDNKCNGVDMECKMVGMRNICQAKKYDVTNTKDLSSASTLGVASLALIAAIAIAALQ